MITERSLGPAPLCARILVVAVVPLLILGAFGGCSKNADSTSEGRAPGAFPPAGEEPRSSPLGSVEIATTRVAALGEMATGLVSDPERRALFVATRAGRILRVPIKNVDGTLAPGESEVVVDLSGSVSTQVERGMLDLALVDEGRQVAVSYTASDGAVTVRLLRLAGTSLTDDVSDPIVLAVPHPFAGHNGGGLALTGNGDLLLSLGDMDSPTTLPPIAQDPSTVLGGIVRIPASALGDGDRPVPVDPSLLIAKGLRNPWRIQVDPVEDDLWIGDVGQETWEEINRLPGVTDHAGLVDFGWSAFEGDEPFNLKVETIADRPVGPVRAYEHVDGQCAVAIGPRYRGTAVDGLAGGLLYGDFCSPKIWGFDPDGDSADEPTVLVELDDQFVVSFGEDALGEVYALTAQGEVLRLDPATWSAPDVPAVPAVDADGEIDPTADPTATADSPVTPEECQAVVALLALSALDDLTPAELEDAINEVRSALDAALATAPPARQAALMRLREVYALMQEIVASNGYSTTGRDVEDFRKEVLAGKGRAEGFADAITTLLDVADGCP